MPCYTVTPAYRRNLVHYNPFFHGSPQGPLATVYPRYSSPSFLQSFQEDLAQFDNFFREVDENLSAIRKSPRSFQPKFDVQEENGTFVLTGELPGVKAEDLKVEFVAKNTLLVEGKIVREETRGENPAAETTQAEAEKAEIESAPAEAKSVQEQDTADDVTMSGALPEQISDTASTTTTNTQNYQKASVEDEETGEAPATEQQPQQHVVKSTPEQEVSKPTTEKQQPNSHYWVSERTVGQFRRVFRFPGKVDQDAVKATLKDGILTVAVPKVVEQEGNRRIQVDA